MGFTYSRNVDGKKHRRMKKIAFIANPCSIHDCKWINPIALKFEVVVICPKMKTKSYLTEKIKIFEILPSKFPRKNYLKRIYFLLRLKKLIKKENISLIHSMYAYPNAFWAYLIHFKRHIITTRGSDILVDFKRSEQNRQNSAIDNYFFNLFLKAFNSAEHITSTSYQQKYLIETFVKNKSKLSVIRSGIDTKEYINIWKKQNVDFKNEVVIFSPRSMKRIYNIDIIVKAFSVIRKSIPKSKLVLIKENLDTDYEKLILDTIKNKHLDKHVILLEKQTKEQMIYWYKNSTIVVSIPTTDGTPNSVLEAMMANKKIIIGNYKYDSDLFSNLYQLKENTVDNLAEKIIFAYKDKPDSIKRENELVEQYANLNNSIKQVVELYN